MKIIVRIEMKNISQVKTKTKKTINKQKINKLTTNLPGEFDKFHFAKKYFTVTQEFNYSKFVEKN